MAVEWLWNGCGTVVERLWNGCGTVYKLNSPNHDEEEEEVERARRDGQQDAVHARHLAQVLEDPRVRPG